MFDIIYSRKSGKVLLSQNSNNQIRFTPEDVSKIFPQLDLKDINIWHTNDDITLYTRVIPLDAEGMPKGFDDKFDKIDKCSYIPSEISRVQDAELTVWRGPFFAASGYANMNRELCLRLVRSGLNLKLEFFPAAKQIEKEIYEELNRYKNTSKDPGKAVITGFVPIIPKGDSRYQIFYTMMETSTTHPEFVRRLNEYADEVWVPTRWNADIFIESGVKKPIHVFPLGVDENKFNPKETGEMRIAYRHADTFKIVEKQKSFKFLSIFRWAFSKSPDLIIRAFAEEFSPKEDVCLAICSHSTLSKKIRSELFSYLEGLDNIPSIYLYTDVMPINMMPHLYKDSDCYVSPSRGEGFCLPLFEAACMEKPVISALNTAMTDFLTDENSYYLTTDELMEAHEPLKRISTYYHGQKFPKLGKKKVVELRQLMRNVYENYAEAQRKAKKFREEVLCEYTWRHAASRIQKRIEKGFSK